MRFTGFSLRARLKLQDFVESILIAPALYWQFHFAAMDSQRRRDDFDLAVIIREMMDDTALDSPGPMLRRISSFTSLMAYEFLMLLSDAKKFVTAFRRGVS